MFLITILSSSTTFLVSSLADSRATSEGATTQLDSSSGLSSPTPLSTNPETSSVAAMVAANAAMGISTSPNMDTPTGDLEISSSPVSTPNVLQMEMSVVCGRIVCEMKQKRFIFSFLFPTSQC